MARPRPRIRLPKSIRAGVPFTVKTRIVHPMHTGLLRDGAGKLVPRRIVNRFAVRFGGEAVLSVDLEPAVSANPYIQFAMAVPGPGLLEFEWFDDDGSVYTLRKPISVD